MILNRLGNKQKIANRIISEFPRHNTFIELFFGAGGLFFQKQIAKYNFCNDLDDDIFNLYFCLQNNKELLIEEIIKMPITENLIKYWHKNKETEPVKKAVRFLLLSNFVVNGNGTTLRFGESAGNEKKAILNSINFTFTKISNVKFMTEDFRKVLSKIQFRGKENNAFVYSDPPYLETNNNYKNSFTEKDSFDCFDVTFNSGIKGAMSEFNHPFILSEAKRRNLNIINIGERQNLKNKRTEILITNYKLERTLFDCL